MHPKESHTDSVTGLPEMQSSGLLIPGILICITLNECLKLYREAFLLLSHKSCIALILVRNKIERCISDTVKVGTVDLCKVHGYAVNDEVDHLCVGSVVILITDLQVGFVLNRHNVFIGQNAQSFKDRSGALRSF